MLNRTAILVACTLLWVFSPQAGAADGARTAVAAADRTNTGTDAECYQGTAASAVTEPIPTGHVASTADDRGWPRYCCTDIGRLGPYPNDSVPEGGACYGTKNGKRYEGTACYGSDEEKKPAKKKKHHDDYPEYCCTRVGRLGPYENDSVPEGGACFGTKNGRRYEGKACYGDDSDSSDDDPDSK